MPDAAHISRSTGDSVGSSIYHRLESQASRAPEAIAVAAPGRVPLTYGRLWTHLNQVVKTLNAMGLDRSDRVAIVLPDGPEAAIAFLAVAAVATSAPLNPALRANEFDFYLADLNAGTLMTQAGLGSPALAAAEARGIPVIELSPVPKEPAGVFTLVTADGPGAAWPAYSHPDDVALVLHTSGTTSQPKPVPLTHANLWASAESIRTGLGLGAGDRCLNVMPLFHIHGLVGAVLASLAAGASVVCTPGFIAPRFFEWLDEFRPTWYTAVPTMHQANLRRAAANRDVIRRAPLRFVRSCSAPLPPKVAAELEAVFSAPVIEAYGMTEAAHQISSNPLPPAERKIGSVGFATGTEVAILDEAGEVLPPGATGEIAIRGANVTAGYERSSEADSRALTNGWFRTGDQGHLDPDGYLFITGRLKEIINRAGEKISPGEVEQALMEHPAVAEVVAFAVPHPELGEDVCAAIVLREDASASETELREFAARRVADFKVPREITIADRLPTGATGKLHRVGLAEKLGIAGTDRPRSTTGGHAEPRTPLEAELARLWADTLGVDRVGVHDDFFHLGGDSMLAVRLVSRVNEAFDVEVPLSSLYIDATTVARLARTIEQHRSSHPGAVVTPSAPIGEDPADRIAALPAVVRGPRRAGLVALLKAVLLIPQLLPTAPFRPLELITGKPRRQVVRFPLAGREIWADLYAPTRVGPHAGLVVLLGATPRGLEDPRAIVVGEAFARSGFVTLVHWPPGAVESIEPDDVEGTVAAFRYLIQRPDVDPRRAGLFGFCTGASYALIAAARPDIAERVAFVNAFAPYFSRRDLIKATLSGVAFSDGGTRPWQIPWAAEPTHRYRWEQMLLGAIPDRAERLRVGRAIRQRLPEPAGLSPEASAVFVLLNGVSPEQADELLERLPAAFLKKLEQTSPHGQLAGLRAETLVMHGVADYVVPVEESRRLVAALSSHVPLRYTEFELFDHVNPTRTVGVATFVRDLARLVAHTRALMRYASWNGRA